MPECQLWATCRGTASPTKFIHHTDNIYKLKDSCIKNVSSQGQKQGFIQKFWANDALRAKVLAGSGSKLWKLQLS